jgi:hypothetical protein
MTTDFIAYTTGYIDGDGCIYAGKFKQNDIVVYEYSIQIVSVKKQVLNTFQEKYGGAVRKKPFKQKHRDAFCWTIKGDNAIKLCQLILPFLTDKKIQCSLLIQFSKLIKPNDFKVVSQNLIFERENIIHLLRHEKHFNNLVTSNSIEALKHQSTTTIPTRNGLCLFSGTDRRRGLF